MRLKNIFLCDAATANTDNTFSVLRGGLDIFSLQDLNARIKISLVATIELDISERGRLHNAEITLLDIDGQRVLPPLCINFQPPAGNTKHRHNVIGDMVIKFDKFGEYCFYINVDGQEVGTQSLYIIQTSAKP